MVAGNKDRFTEVKIRIFDLLKHVEVIDHNEVVELVLFRGFF